ncbi:MAG TPA: aspartate aminotransferase family protein [Gemmatimonadales bacterium]|nr:aspartate aminotransferase family protein [Gemmatimonadales bacterium]
MPRRYPDGHVLYRNLTRDYPLIVSGAGCWLVDDQGRRYLDGCGGAYVACLGHGVPEVVDRVAEQIRTVSYVSGLSFTNRPVEELADLMAGLAMGDLSHFYFLSSGSDAIEAALKLARQYWVERGRAEKSVIVAAAPAYHGNTLLTLSAGARAHYKKFFAPWLLEVPRIPAPYPYRCGCRGGDPGCPQCSGRVLEETLLAIGPDKVAAFIAEPVGGSSTGASIPRPDYWKTVREICDRHEVLWIADEVLVGAGRTGTWSALEPYDAVPDIQVMGKGMSGGFAPLASVGVPRRIADVLAGGAGALLHAQTFSHIPMMCAAGVAVIRYLEEHGLIARCAVMGERLLRALEPLRDHPMVGDIRGRGLLAGIEFVADRETRAPFPRSARVVERVTAAAQEAGLMVWPNSGQANGTDGDLVVLAPPYIVSDAEIDEIVRRLGVALDSVAGER